MIRVTLSLTVMCMMCGAAMAQPSGMMGTPAEQRACSRDATRLCSEQLHDNLAVLACLKRNRAKLRKACLKVLEAHGH